MSLNFTSSSNKSEQEIMQQCAVDLIEGFSPWVHFQPRLQLSCFRSVHSGQDVAAVDMDDLDREVTHLAGLIQRLR